MGFLQMGFSCRCPTKSVKGTDDKTNIKKTKSDAKLINLDLKYTQILFNTEQMSKIIIYNSKF